MRKWGRIKGEKSWTMFKVMAEFVDGFEVPKKISPVPIVLVGKEFWEGLRNWIVEVMLQRHHNHSKDLELFHITDDPEDVVRIINAFYAEGADKLEPNFDL